MPDSNSSFKNWFLGILGTIITGVVLWWLTGPMSPFTNHKDIEKNANVIITGFTLQSPINSGEITVGNFEVTNKGNAAAKGCQLIWETAGVNGAITSDQFDLLPGEKKIFKLTSNPFIRVGTSVTIAHLSCSNVNEVTEKRPVVVKLINPKIYQPVPSIIHPKQ